MIEGRGYAPEAQPGVRHALSVRLPRRVHLLMKERARESGERLSDLYARVVERFVNDEIESITLMYAAPTDSMPVSIQMPPALVERLRGLANERAFFINEIVLTAAVEFLDYRRPRKAA
jgi:hypothetical protein